MTLLNQANDIRLGTAHVNAVYAGVTQVWSSKFTPRSVPGLLWWLDASQLVGAINTQITSWPDLSGHGYNCDALPEGLNPPILEHHAANNLPIALFSQAGAQPATSMQAAGLGTAMSGRNAWSAMLMLFPNTYGSYPIVLTSPTTTQWDWIIEYDANCQVYVGSTNGYYRCFQPPTPPNPPAWTMLSITAQPTATRLWLNTTEITSYRLGPSGDIKLPIPTLSSGVILGAYWNQQFGYGGEMAELLIYDHALSDADRQHVEMYFQTKWGLT